MYISKHYIYIYIGKFSQKQIHLFINFSIISCFTTWHNKSDLFIYLYIYIHTCWFGVYTHVIDNEISVTRAHQNVLVHFRSEPQPPATNTRDTWSVTWSDTCSTRTGNSTSTLEDMVLSEGSDLHSYHSSSSGS